MSIEWYSLNLGGTELKTVGPATENARRANSVRTRGTNYLLIRKRGTMSSHRRTSSPRHPNVVRSAISHVVSASPPTGPIPSFS